MRPIRTSRYGSGGGGRDAGGGGKRAAPSEREQQMAAGAAARLQDSGGAFCAQVSCDAPAARGGTGRNRAGGAGAARGAVTGCEVPPARDRNGASGVLRPWGTPCDPALREGNGRDL